MTQPLTTSPRRSPSPRRGGPGVPARSRPSEARAAATSRLVGGAVPARSLAARPLPADPRRGGSRRHLRIAEVPTRTPAQRRVLVRIFFLGGAALIVAIAFSYTWYWRSGSSSSTASTRKFNRSKRPTKSFVSKSPSSTLLSTSSRRPRGSWEWSSPRRSPNWIRPPLRGRRLQRHGLRRVSRKPTPPHPRRRRRQGMRTGR